MNNPMSSGPPVFPKSPSSGPPIAKKQRGGATPGSIRATRRPPPPRTSSVPPPQAASASSSGVVDEAIARRRAELRRLQEKARGARQRTGVGSSAASRPVPSRSGPPVKRTSDIFPTAPKSPSIPKASKGAAEAAAAATLSLEAAAGSSTLVKPKATSNPNLPPETPLAAIPPTPAVGRRLEFPSGSKPPPTGAATAAAPPASIMKPQAPKSGPPSGPPPARRARSKSPTKSSKKAPSNSVARTRAKSAPPRRPPGPPPPKKQQGVAPPKSPKSPGRGAARPPAKSRPTPVKPASLLPTPSTRSPKPKSPKPQQPTSSGSNSSNSSSDKKPSSIKLPDSKIPPPTSSSGTKASSASSIPPPTPSSSKAPPPTTNSSSANPSPPTAVVVGTGSLDTSKLPEDVTETPRPQKPTTAASGADTPPSSGSSARRQKLARMREQALVASSVTSEKSGGPPTTNSFYAPSGAPATAAFAKATAKTLPIVPALDHHGHRSKQHDPVEADDTKISRTGLPPPASSSMTSAAQKRLEEAYQKSETDKRKALQTIKDLEDKLAKAAQQDTARARDAQTQLRLDIEQLLRVARAEGPQAAVAWAHASGSSIAPKPAAPQGFAATMGMGPMAKKPLRRARMALKAHSAAPDTESPEDTERRLLAKFREAARYVSYEFSSDLATYTVRRPYGMATAPELFARCAPPGEPENAYARRAHVSDQSTVEVAAVATADRTPLLIFGRAGIRYLNGQQNDWTHVDDVDRMDRPLGHATYIDQHANEKEYSLDAILEEALLVREQYCGTLTSTALALPDAPALNQNQQASSPPPLQKPPSRDMGVGTDPEPKTAKAKEGPPPSTQAPPPPDDASGSSDVLVVFFGLLFSSLWSLVWGVLIGLPLRIARTTVVVVVAAGIVQLLHLFLADGYTDWALREAARQGLAATPSDLAFFSNHRPGIL